MNKILLTTTAIITLVSGLALSQEMTPTQSSRSTKTTKPAQTAEKEEGESGAKPKAPRKTTAESAAAALAAKKKAAQEEVSKLTDSQQNRLLELLNEGSEKDLNAIKGIAAARSKMIVAARPLRSIEDIVALKGFGKSTFSNVIQHAIDLQNKKAEPKS